MNKPQWFKKLDSQLDLANNWCEGCRRKLPLDEDRVHIGRNYAAFCTANYLLEE